MANEKKLFSDLFQNKQLSQRLADPDNRKIVEDTLRHFIKMHAISVEAPLTEVDIANYLTDFEDGSFYYLCGLITPEKLKTIPNLFEGAYKKNLPKDVVGVLADLKNAFELKALQLNAEEAQIMGCEVAAIDCFDLEKEQVASQTPYDYMSDFIKMQNYQLLLNYFTLIGEYAEFIDVSCYLSDAINATALNAVNQLRDLKDTLDKDVAKRVLAMCELFESVAVTEESSELMTKEEIRALLKDVDVYLHKGILKITDGDDKKQKKYLQLVDLLTKPKKEIPFLDYEKKQKENEEDQEAFLQKVWGGSEISKKTWDEIDFAIKDEILQTMASNISSEVGDISSDDVLIYLTDTNEANLYYTCGFLSEHEYKIFYRHMVELEQAYDSGIEKRRLKDFLLPELLEKTCEMNRSISKNDKKRILDCYDNAMHVVEYFKKSCEMMLAVRGMFEGGDNKYNLSNPKGLFSNTTKTEMKNDFMRTYVIAHMLNGSDITEHAEKFQKSRLLVTFLSDYYYHDALEKMRQLGAESKEIGLQNTVRVMTDYLKGVTENAPLSKQRVAHTTDKLIHYTRNMLGLTTPNHQVQNVLERFDNVMGARTINRIVKNSWKHKGLLDPTLKSSYMKAR